jgi:hypothetical protein
MKKVACVGVAESVEGAREPGPFQEWCPYFMVEIGGGNQGSVPGDKGWSRGGVLALGEDGLTVGVEGGKDGGGYGDSAAAALAFRLLDFQALLGVG